MAGDRLMGDYSLRSCNRVTAFWLNEFTVAG